MVDRITPETLNDSWTLAVPFDELSTDTQYDVLRDEIVQHYDFADRAQSSLDAKSGDTDAAEEHALAEFQSWFNAHVDKDAFSSGVYNGANALCRGLVSKDVSNLSAN